MTWTRNPGRIAPHLALVEVAAFGQAASELPEPAKRRRTRCDGRVTVRSDPYWLWRTRLNASLQEEDLLDVEADECATTGTSRGPRRGRRQAIAMRMRRLPRAEQRRHYGVSCGRGHATRAGRSGHVTRIPKQFSPFAQIGASLIKAW